VVSGWWVASYLALWALVLTLAVVVVTLARQIGTLRLGPRGALEIDDEGPPLGEAPEPVAAAALDGRELTVGGPGTAQVLLFASPGCRLCEEVLPALPALAAQHSLDPVVVTDLSPDEARSQYGRRRLGAPVIASAALVASYRVPGTPFVVVLDRLGVVRAKGTVNNLEQFEGLIETAASRRAQAGEP
jgi:methylamine dehydrogenase accessory protein MauD